MIAVLVHVHVKPEFLDAFKTAVIENARHSVKEPGVARFDVIQLEEDSARFVLVEVYRSVEAQTAHKETDHYKIWRDTVAEMMAEPRQGVKYHTLFPAEADW